MTTRLLGLVCGLLATGLLPALPAMGATALVLLAAAPLLVMSSGIAHLGGGLLAGVGLAIVDGHRLAARRLPEDCVREELRLRGHIVSLPQQLSLEGGRQWQRFEVAVTDLGPAVCRGPQRVLLGYYGSQQIAPGELWEFQVRLKRPWGLVNPGSANRQAWFAQAGIDATGSAGSRAVRLAAPVGIRALHHRLRARLSAALAEPRLSPEARAVLQAVTVADRSGIDSDLWWLFQAYGITHLLVISGLHIGLVAASAFALGRCLDWGLQAAGAGLWPRLPGVLALLAAAAYTALAGFTLPTVRALVMLGAAVLAACCWRGAGSWRNLLLAAALLLVLNPLAALGSGFWLSFGAVTCLLWLALWQGGGPHWRVPHWRVPLLTHGFMSLAMLPLSAWWFGGFSQVAALANLILVPLLGLYVVPLALAGALCALLGMGAAHHLWQWAGAPLELLLPLAGDWLAAGPSWLYRTAAPGPLEVLLALAGSALLVLPGNWRGRALAPALLLPLLLPPLTARTADGDAVHLLVMDVGQGTAVLVYDRERALLYDTGGPGIARSVILPLLARRGIRRLDTLVVSHGDSDHSAGLSDLRKAIPVGRLLAGKGVRAADARPCRAGQQWRWPGRGVRFQLLSPGKTPVRSRNAGSCVLRVRVGSHTLLLSGDIDAVRERALVREWRGALRSDWLLAAHHGSASSSSHAWLKAVRPQHVIFSHGYANRFSHPHPGVVERSRLHGARVWSTARQGALELVFRADRGVTVIAHRERRRRHWM